MNEMVIQSSIYENRALRILRQDNLRFYAEINARAFRGANMSEVPVQAYLRIIDEVKAVALDQDTTRPARYYFDLMLGKAAGYNREKVEPWIGTDTRGDTEVVVLLEAGAGALRILGELETEQSFLAVSSLSSLTERLSQVVARLSGDVTEQIEVLEARKLQIEADIAGLKARGATPLTKRERQTELYALLHDISKIKAGFSEVPAARRRLNRENQDLFLESEAPVGEVLDTFWERTKAWEESGEAAVLTTLRDMHVDLTRGQTLQGRLEAMVDLCDDLLEPRHRRDVVSFLPDMLEISSDITIEIANIWKSVHSYISNPNYAARREDARALRNAQEAALRVRDVLQPTPRDTRLKDIGLQMTRPMRTAPQTDLKLTFQPPEKIDANKDLAPVETQGDESTLDMMAREKARSAHLGDAAIKKRIAEAMGEADAITLSDVLRRFPLRYGRHEISRYLTIASSHHPSLLVEGMSFILRIEERGIPSAANIPNPIFRRSGAVGEGFGDFPTINYLLTPEELRKMTLGEGPIDHDATTAAQA